MYAQAIRGFSMIYRNIDMESVKQKYQQKIDRIWDFRYLKG